MSDKIDTIAEALAVLQVTGWKGSRAELEIELARFGLDVCIPGVQGQGKVTHRETATYGTTVDPDDRCSVIVPARTRRDLVPEYHYKSEYDSDTRMDEKAEYDSTEKKWKVK